MNKKRNGMNVKLPSLYRVGDDTSLPLTLCLFILFFLFAFSGNIYAQDYSFGDRLYENYESFKEEKLQHRRFPYEEIEPLLEKVKASGNFEVDTAGYSVEGRPIHLLKIGNGDNKVLFWSQMHGDESTATMALFDLFNFFSSSNDAFTDEKEQLLKETTLYFIPMLNPDGAEHFSRRNALDIDINRDALRLTSPESVILKAVRDSLDPHFGFNLHDQSTYYTAGRSSEPATLSFLAPAYDFEQSENEVRSNAMRLIGYLNGMLQQYIPDKVAKYSDAHEPRAFGDMIQKWGTSTILIESGGYPDDPEKQYIRKLNFVTLLTAIEAIGEEDYASVSKEKYFQIPENRRALTDLLVREINMSKGDDHYLVDLNIRRWKRIINDSTTFYRSTISDLGDLSTSHGYEELEGQKWEALPGKVYPDTMKNIQEVRQLDYPRLLAKGYTDVMVKTAPKTSYLADVPFNLVTQPDYTNDISLGATPNFLIKQGDEVQYVVVNGFVYQPGKDQPSAISNTLVID